MPRPFSKIRSAAIDGRALNPIFRKTQLKALHDAISDNASAIQDAIASDTGHTRAEAQIEYWLGMRQLAQAFASLDADQALHEEHSLARSRDAPRRREAVGIVVIQAARHAFFSCLLSALVPALAAGNCVVVQTEQSLLRTPEVVLGLLAQALGGDVFETAPAGSVSDADLDHPHVRVLQNGATAAAADGGPRPSHHLVSDPGRRVVAIVERDADLDLAARELVRARFALRGRSPYAPDVVLVSEWVKKAFLEAVVRHAVRFTAEEGGQPARAGAGQDLLASVKAERGVNVLSWGAAGTVVDVEDRQSALLRRKVQDSCLLVHAVTSIDDAIDLSGSNGRLGAAYVFTQPRTAKYICQFLDSRVSFVNHVPTSLLFYPMAPENVLVQLQTHSPYNEEAFTKPQAQFVAVSSQDTLLAQVLGQTPSQKLGVFAREAVAKLPAVKRGSQGITHFGFFNQGVATGAVILLSTILGVTGVCSYYGFGLVRSRLALGV